jgi:hypothetical protein
MDLCFGIEIRAPDEFDGLDATKKLAILVTKLLVAGACSWYVPRPEMPRACLSRGPKSGLTA